jgi:hypothetical protein
MPSNSPIVRAADGSTHWINLPGDTYLATGTTPHNRRVRVSNPSWQHVRGINLWRGAKWLVRGGKRHLIQRIFN